MDFTKEIILQAIEKIDSEPILRNNRNSSTYDLIYKDVKYPPILVLSVANQLKGGKELFLSDFNDNVDIAFDILRGHDFIVIKKTKMSFYNELIKFIEVADKQEIGKGTIGVQEFNQERLKIYDDLKVETKFGTGRASAIPWISFLSEYDTVQQGIYPVYLYYKLKNVLILAYGISETNKPNRSWNLQNKKTIKEYFFDNNYGEAEKYGSSFVFNAYDIKKALIQKQIDDDLNEIITIYKAISSIPTSTQKEKSKKMVDLKNATKQIKFDINSFQEKAIESGLIFSSQLVNRFVASLCAKPFVICSGLSGSGKTKLAQAFTKWISADKSQYKIVPVGADWTNREPLLGYPNGLNPIEYITPDSGVLHLLLEASKEQNQRKPYFIILDEMNLSHVERYFADFLSIMESKDTVKLYTGSDRSSTDGLDITQQIGWPKNVFIIGTVNIDETTYMFSPKVLDRANVIEFRITEEEIAAFLNNPGIPDLSKLSKQGANMAENFLAIAAISDTDKNEELTNKLNLFFSELKKVGAEFGYRTASEIMQLVAKLKVLEPKIENNECLDIAIMQKLLPKLHGSRSKLVKVLIALAALCIEDKQKEEFIKNFENHLKNDFDGIEVKFDISFEKLIRMYKNVLANGFTSYAEA